MTWINLAFSGCANDDIPTNGTDGLGSRKNNWIAIK